MDDQSPKSDQSSIDDLVKELSRSQNVSPGPSSSSPTSSLPSRPTQNPVNLPRPTPSAPPVPMAPAPVTPTPTPRASQVPQSYQSNIRTMKDDLSNLKSGQQPQGVNIPRTIDPPKPTTPPLAPTPKAIPAPPTKNSTAQMGQAQKTAPLPYMPATKVPPSQSYSTPAPVKLPDVSSQMLVPEAPASAGNPKNRVILLGGIVVAAVVLVVAYWYFMIRQSTEVVEATPIPTLSATPTATPIDVFESVFPNKSGSITLPANGDPASAFQASLGLLPVDPGKIGTVSVVNLSPVGSSSEDLSVLGLFDRFLIQYPVEFKSLVSPHSVILVYGQQETFDAKGRPVANPSPTKRLVLVSEANSSLVDSLKTWEASMTQALSGLLAFDKTKNKGPFLDNSYQGASIRFKNFSNPDHTIDYTVMQYGGRSYWIMSNSREAMFAAINSFLVPGK